MSNPLSAHDQTTLGGPQQHQTVPGETTHHQTIPGETTHHQQTPQTFGDDKEFNSIRNSGSDERTFNAPGQSGFADNETGAWRDRLNSEYEPRTEVTQKRDSLSATQGPFHVPTTEEVSKKDIPPSSSVGTQNAPGRGGSIGEATMGALGYGGATVERPKEEQGLAEKIVNFMGA